MAKKLSTRCLCCSHRERPAIDLALSRGVSAHAVGRRYGVGKDSAHRHFANHVPPQLRAKLLAGPDLDIDLDRLRETESQSLLMNLASLRARLFASLDLAEENGDGHMLAQLSGQLHRNIELVGKLVGELNTGNTSTVNIMLAPMYLELRHALFAALAPFGDARLAVAAAIHKLEARAADSIAATDRTFAGSQRTIEHEPQPQPAPKLGPPPC